jgi:hypothetical protein
MSMEDGMSRHSDPGSWQDLNKNIEMGVSTYTMVCLDAPCLRLASPAATYICCSLATRPRGAI